MGRTGAGREEGAIPRRGAPCRWGTAALAALLAAGCAGAPPPGPEAESAPPPPPPSGHSEEYLRGKEIGQQFLAAALHQYEFRTDYDVAAAVGRVGRRIVTASGADPDTYHFFVVHNPQANAFAIPGGYIFVFDGLLGRLENEEELAGVLAHEIGHVRHNHFFKDQKKVAAADLGVLAAILLGQGGQAVTALSLAGAASLQLAYTRENEREADQTAVELLEKAGYDPNGLPRFFELLHQQERLILAQGQFAYLSTHPGLDERFYRVQRLIAQDNLPVPPPEPPRLWDRLSAALAADDIGRRPPQGGPYREGLAYLDASRYRDARPRLEQAVLDDPDKADPHAALGECLLAMGELERARSEAVRALALDGGNIQARFVLAEVARLEGRTEDAVAGFRDTLSRAPDHALAHFRLSQLLEVSGDPAEARFELARYLRLTLHPDQAYATLRAIQTADPALQERVEAEMAGLAAEGV
jgi:predicted Zn-dependent protease